MEELGREARGGEEVGGNEEGPDGVEDGEGDGGGCEAAEGVGDWNCALLVLVLVCLLFILLTYRRRGGRARGWLGRRGR